MRLRDWRDETNEAQAFIGPTVWEEEGPMPTLNISKTEVRMARRDIVIMMLSAPVNPYKGIYIYIFIYYEPFFGYHLTPCK